MLLIIEIILTVIAWNKGWRWKSLIPMGIAMVSGFIIGLILGLNNEASSILPIGIFLDVVTVIVLSIMCFIEPKI